MGNPRGPFSNQGALSMLLGESLLNVICVTGSFRRPLTPVPKGLLASVTTSPLLLRACQLLSGANEE